MAGHECIAATGNSLERFLNHCFTAKQPLPPQSNTRATLVRTEDLKDGINTPGLSIFLYRVDFNKTMRAAWAGVSAHDQRVHLPLDLHYLLTAWAANAEYEQRILGRVLECLDETPILSGPLLSTLTPWAPGEAIQLCLEDLTTEDVMRTFDSLPVDYKVSLCYVARVVRLDGQVMARHGDVGTVRSHLQPSSSPSSGGPV